jgi:hypothetical protein
MGKSTISMVIFNSYVKLPEGISICFVSCEALFMVHRLYQKPCLLLYLTMDFPVNCLDEINQFVHLSQQCPKGPMSWMIFVSIEGFHLN